MRLKKISYAPKEKNQMQISINYKIEKYVVYKLYFILHYILMAFNIYKLTITVTL